MKKTIIFLLFATFAILFAKPVSAQNSGEYDVFIPIAKYIKQGDVEKLSAWFAGNMEVTVFSTANDVSRNQAKQIVKSFFDSYSSRLCFRSSNASL